MRRFGKDKIKHIHLKDSVGVPREEGRDFIFPLLGEGSIDWQAFFGALREIGYEGYFSAEVRVNELFEECPRRISVRSAEISLQLMKKLAQV